MLFPSGAFFLITATIAEVTTGFIHNNYSIMTNHPTALRDGSHNHPRSSPTSTSKGAESSSHEHTLRDGSHNHPIQSMETIQSRLAALNLALPPPGAPKANYVSRSGLHSTNCSLVLYLHSGCG